MHFLLLFTAASRCLSILEKDDKTMTEFAAEIHRSVIPPSYTFA
jgi:hypothetical protein